MGGGWGREHRWTVDNMEVQGERQHKLLDSVVTILSTLIYLVKTQETHVHEQNNYHSADY